MTHRPRRPCSKCKQLYSEKRCPICEPERKIKVDAWRGSASERGYGSRWAEYSRQYRRNNPLCVRCLAKGIFTSVDKGGHVDHIKAVNGPNDPLFWEPTNHQSLCRPCHSTKTAEEDGSFGNTKAVDKLVDKSVDKVDTRSLF